MSIMIDVQDCCREHCTWTLANTGNVLLLYACLTDAWSLLHRVNELYSSGDSSVMAGFSMAHLMYCSKLFQTDNLQNTC